MNSFIGRHVKTFFLLRFAFLHVKLERIVHIMLAIFDRDYELHRRYILYIYFYTLFLFLSFGIWCVISQQKLSYITDDQKKTELVQGETTSVDKDDTFNAKSTSDGCKTWKGTQCYVITFQLCVVQVWMTCFLVLPVVLFT